MALYRCGKCVQVQWWRLAEETCVFDALPASNTAPPSEEAAAVMSLVVDGEAAPPTRTSGIRFTSCVFLAFPSALEASMRTFSSALDQGLTLVHFSSST